MIRILFFVAAVAICSPLRAQTGVSRPSPPPTPSLEQRVSDLEAYMNNSARRAAAPNTDYSYWVSQNVFAMYQLMFAIITPALIIGSVAERMKFSAVMTIVGLWMFLVYFPLAHMVWGIDGLMNGVWNPKARIRAIDFAGGTVVHMSSGWSALLLCLFLGPRLGFRKETMAP